MPIDSPRHPHLSFSPPPSASTASKKDAKGRKSKSLAQIREISGLTQVAMAERLGIKQANVSRMESRGDLLVSTLTSYVEAVGGSLEISVRIGHDVYSLPLEETRGKKRPRKTRVVSSPE